MRIEVPKATCRGGLREVNESVVAEYRAAGWRLLNARLSDPRRPAGAWRSPRRPDRLVLSFGTDRIGLVPKDRRGVGTIDGR